MSGFTVKIEKTSGVLDNVTAVLDDSIVDLVIDAVAAKYGWTEDCGMTKPRFFSHQIRHWAIAVLKSYQIELAAKSASDTASQAVDTMEATIVLQEPAG